MNLEEAIEILKKERYDHHSFSTDIIGQAEQLGIEAIERELQQYRQVEEQINYLKTLTERTYLKPITELGWTIRTVRALQRHWSGTIPALGQIAVLTDDELLAIRNFGQKSLTEVRETLQAIKRSEGE